MADAVTGHDLIGTPGIRMDAVGGHQRGHGARQGHGTHARQLRAACGQVRHYGPAQFGEPQKDGIISRRLDGVQAFHHGIPIRQGVVGRGVLRVGRGCGGLYGHHLGDGIADHALGFGGDGSTAAQDTFQRRCAFPGCDAEGRIRHGSSQDFFPALIAEQPPEEPHQGIEEGRGRGDQALNIGKPFRNKALGQAQVFHGKACRVIERRDNFVDLVQGGREGG